MFPIDQFYLKAFWRKHFNKKTARSGRRWQVKTERIFSEIRHGFAAAARQEKVRFFFMPHSLCLNRFSICF
jgi:hypothetical protein